MCSTTIKNSPNDYCIQERNKENYASLVYYKHKLEAYNTRIPDAGINMGPMNASILSHNYAVFLFHVLLKMRRDMIHHNFPLEYIKALVIQVTLLDHLFPRDSQRRWP